jgi:hypothetical protein
MTLPDKNQVSYGSLVDELTAGEMGDEDAKPGHDDK